MECFRSPTISSKERMSIMKFEKDITVTTYETLPTPVVWVAVYFYKNMTTPSGMTFSSKEYLIQAMSNITGINEDKPVKIFKLEY